MHTTNTSQKISVGGLVMFLLLSSVLVELLNMFWCFACFVDCPCGRRFSAFAIWSCVPLGLVFFSWGFAPVRPSCLGTRFPPRLPPTPVEQGALHLHGQHLER